MELFLLALNCFASLCAFFVENDPALIPKNFKKYEFAISNNEVKNFGYKIGEDGVAVGPSDILITDANCYILDPAHQNFKIIDLKSGKLAYSQLAKTGREISFLNKLVSFNDHIYVLSLRGIVFKYDKSGKLIRTIQMSDFYNDKFVYAVEKSRFTIFQDADFEQLADERIRLPLKHISSDDLVVNDTVVLKGLRDYSKLRETVSGKYFKVEVSQGKTLLKTGMGSFIIDRQIPKTDYSANTLDFSKKLVVFFDVEADRLVLNVYEY